MHLKNLKLEHCTDEELALMAEKDSEAMCVLISRYTRLIRWKASMMCGSVEADDLAQEGFMGLLSADFQLMQTYALQIEWFRL